MKSLISDNGMLIATIIVISLMIGIWIGYSLDSILTNIVEGKDTNADFKQFTERNLHIFDETGTKKCIVYYGYGSLEITNCTKTRQNTLGKFSNVLYDWSYPINNTATINYTFPNGCFSQKDTWVAAAPNFIKGNYTLTGTDCEYYYNITEIKPKTTIPKGYARMSCEYIGYVDFCLNATNCKRINVTEVCDELKPKEESKENCDYEYVNEYGHTVHIYKNCNEKVMCSVGDHMYQTMTKKDCDLYTQKINAIIINTTEVNKYSFNATTVNVGVTVLPTITIKIENNTEDVCPVINHGLCPSSLNNYSWLKGCEIPPECNTTITTGREMPKKENITEKVMCSVGDHMFQTMTKKDCDLYTQKINDIIINTTRAFYNGIEANKYNFDENECKEVTDDYYLCKNK